MDRKKSVFQWIEKAEPEMVELQRILTSVPALSPESEGDGETAKAYALISWCKDKGIDKIENYPAPDERVSTGGRPNLVLTLPGESEKNALWIMSHLDIVPPGDMEKWSHKPYEVHIQDGRIYGRGTEDNQQGIVSSLFAFLALRKYGVVPKRTVKLLFVADEEMGSRFGIQYLLRDHDLFRAGDMFLVPDGGNSEGTMIEVAEKSVLWLEFTTTGKQCHASRPELGKNAFLAGSELVVKLAGLRDIYPRTNSIFSPPASTFTPTKKTANVPNINTIPGIDLFCLDCRILPEIPVDTVLGEIDRMCREIENAHKVTVSYKIVQRVESKATAAETEIVQSIKKAVTEVYGVTAEAVGIGGGTVAAYLRNAGYDTVVWARQDETAHLPDEYCKIDDLIGDAQVMAHLMIAE